VVDFAVAMIATFQKLSSLYCEMKLVILCIFPASNSKQKCP